MVYFGPWAALCLVSLCIASTNTEAAERAGETTKVQPDAYQRDGFFPQFLEVGDEVVREAKLYTEEFGSMDVRFDDNSVLTLGPNSEIVIDDYVYAPDQTTGKAVLSFTQGALRMISGSMPKEAVTIATPVATIGIRGTEFWLDVNTVGSVKIWVDDGIVAASPNASNEVFELEAPAYAVCNASTCERSDPPIKPAIYPIAPLEEEREDRGGGDGGSGGD